MKLYESPLEMSPAYVAARTMARWWDVTTPVRVAFPIEGDTEKRSMTLYSLIYALAVTDTWMQLPATSRRSGSTQKSSNILSFSPYSKSGTKA